MRILLDVDGVLANFVGGCITVLRLPHNFEETLTEWSFIESLPAVNRNTLQRWLALPQFWAGLELIPGAQAGVEALRNAGHELVFVTSPWTSCKEWGYQRQEWLREHFHVQPQQIVVTCNKALICGDVLIEDRPKQIKAWMAANPGKNAYLYLHSYNRTALPGVPRFTWADIPKELL